MKKILFCLMLLMMALPMAVMGQNGKPDIGKLKELAFFGYPEAQCRLGIYYLRGENVEKDVTKAIDYLEKSADQGFASAQASLGIIYYSGSEITPDYEKAKDYLEKAAAQDYATAKEILNNPKTQVKFGDYYLEKKDYKQAFEWFEKAAMQGNVKGQYYIGIWYMIGQGVEKDEQKALEWLKKAAAQGDQTAINLVAQMENESASKNEEESYETTQDDESDLEQRANNGDAEAQLSLGYRYAAHEDYNEVVKWFTKAAEQGNAEAQWALGSCYYAGLGVTQNDYKAAQWFTKAAEQGFAEAQYELGKCYYYGNGVTEDYTKAAHWYTKAAEQGNADAQEDLGECYALGQGVPEDYYKAVQWWTKAAEQKNEDTQQYLIEQYNNSGDYYFSVDEYKKAVQWWTRSAELGDAKSQLTLGLCYCYGKGITQDTNKGFQLIKKSAEQGNKDAIEFLEENQ